MKNFKNYAAEKYATSAFQEIEEGIYRTKNPYPCHIVDDEYIFVTSLTFEMEPGCYGEEDGCPQDMPQVPIEGILDEFNLFVTDFYEERNEASAVTCYQEFGSLDLENIRNLRTLIGKRFYAVPYINERDGGEYYNMVIE